MMSNKLHRPLALAGAAAALALGMGASSALATSQTGTAKAAIVQAIVLTESVPMNFGYLVPSASAGTVVLATNGTATPTNVTYLNGAAAGTWSVQGTAGQPLVVQLDTSDTLTGPGPAMTIDTFTNDAPATFVTSTVTFDVGATLHVGTASTQTAGNYSGTYTVQVNY